MSEQETTDYFDVTEAGLSEILDVPATADTPPAGSSTAIKESVESAPEITDGDGESETSLPPPEASETDTSDDAPPEEEPLKEESERQTDDTDSDLLVEAVEPDGKKRIYDFSTAPKEMRQVFKTSNKLVNAFIRDDIETVLSELDTLSPSSFGKLASEIVQQSAQANPDKWAEYLVKQHPQKIVQHLLGKETAAESINTSLLTELYNLYTEDSTEGEDLRFVLETRNPDLTATAPKEKLTPAEKAELEELRASRRKDEENSTLTAKQKIYDEVFTYIEDEAVVPIVRQLGFMPDKNDSPEVIREKRRVVNSLQAVIDQALREDAETAKDYEKFNAKLDALDKSGAMALLPSVIDKIRAETMSYLGYIANARTNTIKEKFTPAKKPPQTLANAGSAPSGAGVQKELTLAEMLEADDSEILRAMGHKI